MVNPDADPADVLVSVTGVEKDYRTLRPLRIRDLSLRAGESVALLGLDQAAAEVLVNLIAGATLPDTGTVRVLGQLTSEINDGEAWMKALDRLGIISERAVLLDQMTAEQNLAVPLSLDLHDLPGTVKAAVARLAEDVGLDASQLPRFASTLSSLDRMRLRLARALAVNPRVVMAEHPNASLSPEERPVFASDLLRVAIKRQLAVLVLTADAVFAGAVADHVFIVNPATGELRPQASGWRRWFS